MFPLLLGLLTPGAAPPPEDLRPLLRSLYNEYRWLGLPLPPRGAKLVLVEDQARFLYRQPGRGAVLLHGADVKELRQCPRGPRVVSPGDLNHSQFPAGPEFAIHCHAAGYGEMALAALFKMRTSEHYHFPFHHLRALALQYCIDQAMEEGSDWHAVIRRLRITQMVDRDRQETAGYFIEGMGATLKSLPAKRGTVEALFDDLIKHRASYGPDRRPRSPAYDRLVKEGFAAVPALIRALDDKRLTRLVFTPSGLPDLDRLPHRIDWLASRLLQDIAGQQTAQTWGKVSKDGRPTQIVSKKSVEQWWARVRDLGEQRYYFYCVP